MDSLITVPVLGDRILTIRDEWHEKDKKSCKY